MTKAKLGRSVAMDIQKFKVKLNWKAWNWFLYSGIIIIWVMSSEKVPLSMHKMFRFTSACTCAKSIPGICSLLKHSIIYLMILLADSKDPDQTAWIHRLICTFTVRICKKTRFHMVWPI